MGDGKWWWLAAIFSVVSVYFVLTVLTIRSNRAIIQLESIQRRIEQLEKNR